MRTYRRSLLSLFLLLTIGAFAQSPAQAQRLHFRVTVSSQVAPKPVSGRLLILMTSKPVEGPMITPVFGDNAHDVWIAAKEVHSVAPGASIDVDPDEIAYPAPLSKAPAADYKVMALLDVAHHAAYSFENPGDLYSATTDARQLNPSATAPIEIALTQAVPDKPIKPAAGTEMLDFISPALSMFWGRPVHIRGVIALPPGYGTSSDRYPTVYTTAGFGADLHSLSNGAARKFEKMKSGSAPEMIWVFLDHSCPYGTHEFADSVNNGPWGKALTTELIPYLEKKYRMDARPSGRFLTGHSSGGWSTLWLQVAYPSIFGGTWSTSPDPVDFRSFTGPDLTKLPANAYRRPDGTAWPLVRMNGKEVQSLEDYARQEVVLGEYGGQMRSFDAVFSPRADDMTPMFLFDRQTGQVDPAVAKAWEKYDISRILRDHWKTLGPQLRGKIHIIVGTADTFHLDEPVRLLDAELKKLGSDAKITYLEGRTHFDLYQGGLDEQIAREMYAVARPAADKKPAARATNAKPAPQAVSR